MGMLRHMHFDMSSPLLLVDLEVQLVPGTFTHAPEIRRAPKRRRLGQPAMPPRTQRLATEESCTANPACFQYRHL